MSLSVVAYTLNPGEASPCLEALRNQTRRDFEIILVDGSNGVSAARNEGIRRATGDIVAFTEADGIPAQDWVEKILLHMKNEKGITGRVVHPRADVYKIINDSVLDQGDEEKYTNVLSGGNMAFSRDVFSEVGLFDERIDWAHNETEFAVRYLRQYPLKYCPDVVFYHWYAKNLRHYLKKQFLFGKNAVYLWQKQGLSGGQMLRRMIPRPKPTKVSLVQTMGRVCGDLGIVYARLRKERIV